ncbi:hypothetical protein PUNSTDRAFT_145771 [Punctularia strigosozonata HHB-11173 SS5]|uniref:uncharacterized protein n=1 Tax=Punctularia strigosozonata (strain HHB-11173) TaxID=741275 RepID=UPI0004418698|nr:uncharacterized protein PUNSTDRAFT_145771 [Punctularia strigosozonata HHB-11173 SS5]EIN05870.1 hypothetical protein PUNSTDRAFT_145771 [Punctularia strigosozonata HHB-11173 SS5]
MPSVDAAESSTTGGTGNPQSRKSRPPQLSLGLGTYRPSALSNTVIEYDSPVDVDSDLQLSSPGSSTSGEFFSNDESDQAGSSGDDAAVESDDLTRGLKSLSALRKKLSTNLRLRPIKSSTSLKQQNSLSPRRPSASALTPTPSSTGSFPSSAQHPGFTPGPRSVPGRSQLVRSPSPTSTVSEVPSVYWTPTSGTPLQTPLSAHFIGPSSRLSVDLSKLTSVATPSTSTSQAPLSVPSTSHTFGGNPKTSDTAYFSPTPSPGPLPSTSAYGRESQPVEPSSLATRLLSSPTRPLLIDTRPLPAYLSTRLQHSINLAIPTLILKRCRNPKNAFQSIHALRQYITTDEGREEWDELLGTEDPGADEDVKIGDRRRSGEGDGGGWMWDGDVIVYDNDMDEKDKGSLQSTAWAMLPVLGPLLHHGSADYLKGGLAGVLSQPDLHKLLHNDSGMPMSDAQTSGISIAHLGSPRRKPAQLAVGGSGSPGPSPGKKPGGLFQLNTQVATRFKTMPVLDLSNSASSEHPSPSSALPSPSHESAAPTGLNQSTIDLSKPSEGTSTIPLPSTSAHSPLPSPGPSPLPMMSSNLMASSSRPRHHTITTVASGLADATPSPPPSQLSFSRPPPPRRPSVPSLRKLDTTSAERLNMNLPKLQVRTLPVKSLTLSVPPSAVEERPSMSLGGLGLRPPRSPTHLNLVHSNHSPPGSAFLKAPSSFGSFPYSSDRPPPSPAFHSSFHTGPPPSPGHRTPRSSTSPLPPSPSTARPTPDTEQPPSTSSDAGEREDDFTISTILPNFLFLGPELTTEEHVQELLDLGVKRILNIAMECDDDQGLGLRQKFERYSRIPMRDTVEEDNIRNGVREACQLLDDARLHSAPTYVHCKAGKSRSVTAVIAYLIHANRWTLSRAYGFVKERRKGVSPNIGFVSELMVFEVEEIGGKSKGVVQPSSAGVAHDHDHDVGPGDYTHGGRRPAGMRDSLPPPYVRQESDGVLIIPGVNDSGQEMEIKDSEGRYRHVRRAPVDETTLQPIRRVSKAGLESTWYM